MQFTQTAHGVSSGVSPGGLDYDLTEIELP